MSSPAAHFSAPGRKTRGSSKNSRKAEEEEEAAAAGEGLFSPMPGVTYTNVSKTPDTSIKRVQAVYSRLKQGAVADRERELGGVLHSLVSRQEKAGLLLLLKQGADPNGSAESPFTPLYVAAEMGLAEYCAELLRHGASVTRKNNSNGECALEAALKQSEEVKQMFLLHIARLEEADAMRAAFSSSKADDSPYKEPRAGQKRQRTA